ncbi:PEP-CTERM sorting domain-containing protein [Methylobacillus glycogenes]|uniref:PEP-CTERM sorting domain-containing protein n=1 Tax=Methylobacillus glycogenes TaxID=406 RepID=UPI00056D380A|nr:PEP-CTERM sorting domain-containing protein [Methylobacillus glycogenes]
MKQLLAGIALMGFVATASATTYSGNGYELSTDDLGWTFDGSTITKLYDGVETTHQGSETQETLAYFTFSITPKADFLISEITLSISGLLNATPYGSLPFATAGLYAPSTIRGFEVVRMEAFVAPPGAPWPVPVSFTEYSTFKVSEALPDQITFFIDAYTFASNASSYIRLDSFSLQVYAVPTAAIPEPTSYAMLLAGLGLLGGIVRRKNIA